MGSTPTDGGPAGGGAADPAERPAPLSAAALDAVPGVLGRIARERATDYARTAEDAPVAGRAAPSASAASTRRGALARALRRPGLALVAEVKRASPSQGAIRDLDPVETARAYVGAGAAAVSVLTEERHFGGRLEHLAAVSEAIAAPTLRKDFVVHPLQVEEARRSGASGVLLIAAVLGDALPGYLRYAAGVGLDALVEVHDEGELERAVAAGAELVGVNNRDLRSLEIDRGTAPRLIGLGRSWGAAATWVAESGYATAEDLDEVRDLADAVLVGTSLARSPDLAAAVRALVGSPVHDARP